MQRMKIIENRVLEILEDTPAARDNEFVLLCEYYDRWCGTASLRALAFKADTQHIPTPESITRARRRIFETRKDLKPSPIIQELRNRHREEIEEYVKH